MADKPAHTHSWVRTGQSYNGDQTTTYYSCACGATTSTTTTFMR